MKKILCILTLVIALVCTFSSCAHEHEWGGWQVTQAATCTTEGSKERSCSCGEKETQVIPAQHKYNPDICTVCNEQKPSKGLEFKSIDGGWEVDFNDANADPETMIIVIPPVYNGIPVIKIAAYAFSLAKLYSVEIPEGVKEIGESAFSCSEISSISFPSSIEIIGSEAFLNCENLVNIYIEDNVKIIKDRAFKDCTGLYTLTIGSNNATTAITDMEEFVFSGCKNLESVTLNNCVKRIGEYAFHDCTLLYSVKLSESVEEISKGAFFDSGLKKITIPNGVKTIEYDAFWDCPLESIIIPKSVTYIGNAFNWCTKLKCIYFEGSEAEWNKVANDCNLEIYNDCFFYSENQPEANGVLWRYVNGVPRTWACSNCGGDGHILFSNKLYTCSKCNGTGNDY